MKPKFIDCFLLMNTALSLKNNRKLPEMERPLTQETSVTPINITFTLLEINLIEYKSMEIQTTILLNQRWNDPRLKADETTRKMAVGGQIWRPKVTNLNGISTSCQNIEEVTYWRGSGDGGDIFLSQKFVINSFCSNDLKKFPFDVQECSLKFGTYRFPIEEVEMIIGTSSNFTIKNNLGEFYITGTNTYEDFESRESGNYSVATLTITIQRNCNNYIYNVILPSIIVVLICYSTFWFNSGRFSSRYAMNIFCVIFLLYLYYNDISNFSPRPYLKALDKFLMLSLMFTLVSLIENFLLESFCVAKETLSNRKNMEKVKKIVENIDTAFKIAYPLVYIAVITILFYFIQ